MAEYDPRLTPWRIDEAEFERISSPEERFRFLLRYAVLAPSGHNTQPWSFHVTPDGIEVYADYERRLPIADPDDRELLMSVGAAIANLRVASAHFGLDATVMYQPRSEESLPLAFVAIGPATTPDASLGALFPAITARRTNRKEFDSRPLEDETLAAVCEFIDAHDDSIRFVVPHERTQTANLVAQADRILLGDRQYREELADWVRPAHGTTCDGMCSDSLGLPPIPARISDWMLRHVDISGSTAKQDRRRVEAAAGLVVITADDDRTSLLRAGEALETLLLLLTTRAVQYSFINSPVEASETREELRSLVRCERPPQLLLRIGYAEPVERAAPRRRVESVLV